jgi:hypothetical protein
MQFCYSLSLSLSDPNIFLSILFLNTPNLCSSLDVKELVPYPHKTTSKIMVMYILIFILWNNDWKTKGLGLKGSSYFVRAAHWSHAAVLLRMTISHIVFMTYCCTQFHMPSPESSLATAKKQKV